jgi:hypothetical protein
MRHEILRNAMTFCVRSHCGRTSKIFDVSTFQANSGVAVAGVWHRVGGEIEQASLNGDQQRHD